MNSINVSTGFSNFQIISQIETDSAEAKDNLLCAKVFHVYYTNLNRSPDIPFEVGDKVMLSTLHHHQQFKKKGEKQAAKFFPRFDGPYNIIDAHVSILNDTLKLSNSPNTFPTYHASKLKPFILNDSLLFPSRELSNPQPIVTEDSLEEFLLQDIIDTR